MRKYRLLFIGSLLLGIMVIVLTGSRFWFEDGLLGSETLERLRSMENIRKMSWTKVLRCVMTASAMSRPILEQVGAIVPLRAQQVVVPVLAVGLCYEVESDVLRMLVYYILSLMSVNSPADSVLRAAFCHYPENYITLMEYYDPAEHGMEAYTRK
jgi:hypothetical protein